MKFKLNQKHLSFGTVSEKYADAFIHIADKNQTIKANKVILAFQSSYFDRIFHCRDNMQIVDVCFTSIHPTIVSDAIRMMYGEVIEVLDKYSKQFIAFLKLLELGYEKEDIEKETSTEAKEGNIYDQTTSEVDEVVNTSGGLDLGAKAPLANPPDKPNHSKKVATSNKRGNSKSPSPEMTSKRSNKRKKLRTTYYEGEHEHIRTPSIPGISSKDSNDPSKTKPANISKANKEAIKDHSNFDENWTETSGSNIVNLLKDIDFRQVATEGSRKNNYECSHCGRLCYALAEAETHFQTEHQDCGDAPAILKAAMIHHETALECFKRIKKELDNNCNKALASNQLL